jgi:hypothetical protein
MPITAVAITGTTPSPCKGFTLEVKVVPKKDLRLHVIIDKSCVHSEARWALIFELERKVDAQWTQIVFVSYKPKLDDAPAQQGIQKMLVDEKLSRRQLAILKDEVIPVTALLESAAGPTATQSRQIEAASRKLVVAEI